jgi:hypothetical protein
LRWPRIAARRWDSGSEGAEAIACQPINGRYGLPFLPLNGGVYVTVGGEEGGGEMRTRVLSAVGAIALAAGAPAPAAGRARVRPAKRAVALHDHCIVKSLPGGLELTLCYVTP